MPEVTVDRRRIPAEAFPPGIYLRDELDARGWTQTEFAEIIGRPTRVVNEIISAKRSITPDTANELSAALGTSAKVWLNLEASYQLAKAKPASDDISIRAMLREKFPVREMMKRGWIKSNNDVSLLQREIFDFFNISSIEEAIQFPHAARRNYETPLSAKQNAWLFRVKKLAEAIPAKPYSSAALQATIPVLKELLVAPEEARRVPKLLSDSGVRFVIVEPFPGSKIDGVCFWVDGNKSPVIGMTLRFDRNDNFWFVLRHEIEHVLKGHGKLGMMFDEDIQNGERDISDEEQIANEAASDFCTPAEELSKFIARVKPYFSEKKIVRFSRRIGRHPGIVVGQLQNRLNRPELLNKLKPKIRVHVVGSAFTDGWGEVSPF